MIKMLKKKDLVWLEMDKDISGTLLVTKIFSFEYAHYLPDYPGKCKNLHGHRGILKVTVSGPPKDAQDDYPGMIVDFSILKKIVVREVIDKFDHNLLNDVFPEENPPTAENMTVWVVNTLSKFFGNNLRRVQVYETNDSFAEFIAK